MTRLEIDAARLLGSYRWRHRSFEAAGGVVSQDEVPHSRQDLLTPAAAVEDTVVADALLEVVATLLGGQAGDDRVCGPGLAGSGDIVQLAFDRQHGGVPDGRRIDLLALPFHCAAWQCSLLEHGGDGLQIELR